MEKDQQKDPGNELAKLLKALGHPVRMAIIKALIDKSKCPHGCNPCSCGDKCEGKNCKCGCRCSEFVELFPMSQSTVSQHIKELKTVGLIDLNGRKGNYTLNHSKLSESLILLLDFLGYQSVSIMENKNCNCGENCNCGPECNCGPDCQCANGGECTCGDNCNCK